MVDVLATLIPTCITHVWLLNNLNDVLVHIFLMSYVLYVQVVKKYVNGSLAHTYSNRIVHLDPQCLRVRCLYHAHIPYGRNLCLYKAVRGIGVAKSADIFSDHADHQVCWYGWQDPDTLCDKGPLCMLQSGVCGLAGLLNHAWWCDRCTGEKLLDERVDVLLEAAWRPVPETMRVTVGLKVG